MRKIALLCSTFLLCGVLAFAQQKTITGKVMDDKGDPVPFATITIKGTRSAAVADASGSFSIKAKQGDVLVVTAQGLTSKEAAVGAGSTVAFTMDKSATTSLEEVVVSGAYNTKRTARSTSYNAQVVNQEQLNTIRQTNLNNALAGKVSGLQVRGQSAAALGRTGNIRLRGAGGLGEDQGVIYVVDGTILPSPDGINLDDIEDVSILQGPAASAQFGSQGANGAIVMTLKKAKRNQKGIGVDVNMGAQFDKVYVLPNYQNTYAGGNVSNMYKYTWQAGQPEEWKALDGKYYPDYSDDASWGPRMVGQEYIPWYAWYGGSKYSYKTATLDPQPNNAKDFYNTGVTLNNTVSFSKATDNMNIRLSYGNVDVKGLIPTSSLKKNTFNAITSIDLNKHFTVAANINYITQKTVGEFDDGYSNQTTGSFNQWFHRDLDMNIMRELKDLKTPDGIYASWNHLNPDVYDPTNPRQFFAGNYWYNFYTWFDLVKQYSNFDRLYGDVSLTYKITNDLRIKGTYRKQQNNTWGETKFASDLVTSGTQTTGNCGECKGYYGTGTENSNRQNYELLASYSKKIGDFQINANAGLDFFRWVYKSNSANTNNGLSVPNYYAISNSKDQPSVFNGRLEEKYRAVYGIGSIGYRNFIFADFTLRNDWYSTLPPVNNDVLSKSFGASFVFSDLVKVPWLSFGKIRASWGEIPQALGTSSTTFGAYRYPGFAYGVGQFQWNGNILMGTPDVLVDSAIHGAVKTQKEIGVELRFLRNRVGITATYWDGTEKDFPFEISVNGASGFTRYLTNSGEITKKGLDFQFMVKPVWMDNIRWELNATFSKLIENKVVSIATQNGVEIERTPAVGNQVWGNTMPYAVMQKGETWGQIYGNGIKRINGQPVLTSSGAYVNDPNVYFGSVLPDYTGGVQNTIELFKQFTVAFNLDYQVGGKFVSLSNMWGSYSGLTKRTAGVNDKGNPIRDAVADGGGVHVFGVDADGKPVDYYVEGQDYYHNLYNNKTFDEFVYDLTFVKLREVSIGYSIPVNKLGIDKWATKAVFSLVARNPVLIYAKTKDFDPSEISGFSGESGNMPGTRGIGFNLKVGF